MKKLLFFLLLCITMVSCQSSKLKSEAQKQIELTLKEAARDPSSMKLSNMEVVYNDDSLCIIHVDYTGKNGLGNEISSKMEYVMLSYKDKYYEAFQELSSNNDEKVYCTKEEFEKSKKGQIYEKLSYESALYYLAAVFINTQGREAGVKDGEYFSIPVPTGTGSWQIGAYTDEFGQKTNEKFLFLEGAGVFSNSATTNSRLLAAIYVDSDDVVSILLVEYGSSIVKTSDTYEVHVKDNKEKVYDMTMRGAPDTGRLFPVYYNYDSATMEHILNSKGFVSFSIKERESYGTSSTYVFMVDMTGYAEAKKYCAAF